MEYRGYSEQDLVSNRAAVLLYGGDDAERMEWAREAAGNFATDGPLVEAADLQALQTALTQNKGVVFVPNLPGLGPDAQSTVLQCLRGIEERPKLILGLTSPDQEGQQGQLREDLAYRLQLAHVNLDSPGLRDSIRSRRLAREEELASVKAIVPPEKPAATKRPVMAKRSAKAKKPKKKVARKPQAKKKAKPKKKARAKPKKAKKSARPSRKPTKRKKKQPKRRKKR